MIEGHCHCSRVAVLLPRRPRVLTRCNCSYCRRLNPLFAYYASGTLKIDAPKGSLQRYVWGRGVLFWYRCKSCGCFTHHEPSSNVGPKSRFGINCHMVDPRILEGVLVNLRDGAADSWKIIDSRPFGEVR